MIHRWSMVLLAWTAFTGPAAAEPMHWYRCNTHTHTSARPNSDANATPEEVAQWYRAHGYQCLVITDHEFLTDVTALNRPDFLVLPGQEITQMIADASMPNGRRHYHINGLGIDKVILPVGHPELAANVSAATVYRRNSAAIRAAGGIAQVNHPNLQWSVRPADLDQIEQPFLLEIWNAFPTSHNLGGTDPAGVAAPSTEAFWDQLLTAGKTVWGVASDDAHEYRAFDNRETPTPGKAWIVVRAPELTAAAVMQALREGQFYASTGVSIAEYSVDAAGISITLAQTPEWSPGTASTGRFVTRFIGAGGKVLATVTGDAPRYRFKGDERYVRAAITDADGRAAWTQPRSGTGQRK